MTASDPDGSGYFLYHSIGQYLGKAAALARAKEGFAAVWGTADDGQWPVILDRRAQFIDHWRNLIGAPQRSVTTCENVTGGLYALIGALPAQHLAGRRVLVAGDCFPSLHFLLTGLQARFGFTLETVPLRPGAHWVDDGDMIAAWGPDVGLALLTWVSSTSSNRCDLDRLVAHGRAQGSLIGVDITQAAGLLPFDVGRPAVDFALSTSLKWMCGTPGAGILHVAPDLIATCQPEFRGWFSQQNPFSWGLDDFAYAEDIRRFDNGTPGTVSAAASLPAMEWHARQDIAALAAHNRTLTTRLIDGFDGIGAPLMCPRARDQRGGSVMVRAPDDTPAATILDTLRATGVYADARGSVLRFSPGVMTTDAGVDRLIDALSGMWRPGQSKGAQTI